MLYKWVLLLYFTYIFFTYIAHILNHYEFLHCLEYADIMQFKINSVISIEGQ